MTEISAYNEALQSGQYEKPTGLLGKYDNVRRFWEDEEVGLYLRPYLKDRVTRTKEEGQGIRVLDIGCGSGDGLEVISTAVDAGSSGSGHSTETTQPAAALEFYKGIDINEQLLKQAQTIFSSKQNMHFVQSDINEFHFDTEEPYDLYLANYGTLSHNTDGNTVELLAKIARHGKNGAIVLIDWLGRYAYEWQTLWSHDLDHEQWMDYVISYIYSADEAKEKEQELTAFPLRIMGHAEIMTIYQKAKEISGGSITLRKLADRSSFVGRHQDTAQYNPHCKPLRSVINRLLEPNVCTDLNDLLINYVPKDGFDEVNAYHQKIVDSWNYLVCHTKSLLEGGAPPTTPIEIPPALRTSIDVMDELIGAASKTTIGNPRACLVEPQLAYCLRELEMGIQQGLGCGHGLIAIFEVVK